VSASLSRLESKGLIERRRDPRDKRRTSLGLTSGGRALDQPAEGTVERAVERLLDGVPADQLETMARVVDRLTVLLSEEAQGE
jgi:DNA-binding MarR family transcriptional regulator